MVDTLQNIGGGGGLGGVEITQLPKTFNTSRPFVACKFPAILCLIYNLTIALMELLLQLLSATVYRSTIYVRTELL